MRRWLDWCDASGRPDIFRQGDDQEAQLQLADFIAHLVKEGLAGTTVKNYVYKVIKWHSELAGVPLSLGFAASVVMSGAQAVTPAPTAKAIISATELQTIISTLDPYNPEALMLRSALVCAFAGAWRVSTYAHSGSSWTTHTVRWRDVYFFPNRTAATHVCILQRSSKTQRPGSAPPREMWFGRVDDASLCPVLHLQAWADAASKYGVMRPLDCVFTHVDVMGRGEAVRASYINRFLKKRAAATGIAGGNLTSHCLRISSATSAAISGMDIRAIELLGGWSSDSAAMRAVYLRDFKTTVGGATNGIMSSTGAQITIGVPALPRPAPINEPGFYYPHPLRF